VTTGCLGLERFFGCTSVSESVSDADTLRLVDDVCKIHRYEFLNFFF
jgi:hypothetical protein